MGTRSTITIYEKENDTIIPVVNIYQHYDGYLEGVGKSFCEWLMDKTIVNGLSYDDKYRDNVANGIGCLVAQYIRDIKDCAGDVYIYPIIYDIYKNVDYNYIVTFDANHKLPCKASDMATITINSWGNKPFFKGNPKELLEYIEKQKEEDE